ncbi:hypothetical protein MTP99_016417 [Tenebrio molitor]|nr:hypothetical protein MTP99_016417 [Tenebrio molitor]
MRPSRVSIEKSGGFQSGAVTGQPPSTSRTSRRGASPIFRIWTGKDAVTGEQEWAARGLLRDVASHFPK